MYINENQFDLIEECPVEVGEDDDGEIIMKTYVKLVRRVEHSQISLMLCATLSMFISMFVLGFQVYMGYNIGKLYFSIDVCIDIAFTILNFFITACFYSFDFS
jgi:hypothetical protein